MAHHSEVCGLVDQLEDRLLCKQEVASSNLAQSTLVVSRFVSLRTNWASISSSKVSLRFETVQKG